MREINLFQKSTNAAKFLHTYLHHADAEEPREVVMTKLQTCCHLLKTSLNLNCQKMRH